MRVRVSMWWLQLRVELVLAMKMEAWPKLVPDKVHLRRDLGPELDSADNAPKKPLP